jgi:hypothetical protein
MRRFSIGGEGFIVIINRDRFQILRFADLIAIEASYVIDPIPSG